MGGGSGRRGHLRPLPKKPKIDAVRNDINVTPLVDVCLVLLIIFMVITPMMARGKEVPLPLTDEFSKEKDMLQPVISVGPKVQGGEPLIFLAGSTSVGKQELREVGLLSDIEDGAGTAYERIADDLKKELERYWEIAQNPEAKNKLYLKVAADLPYKKVYPMLMLLNSYLAMDVIDLGTAERKKE